MSCAKCIRVVCYRHRNMCYHSSSQTPLPMYSVLWVTLMLYANTTKKLPRIQVNKSNPKFMFRVVYLKGPITSAHGGHNITTQLHLRRNSFCNYDPRNDGSHSAFWFNMGRAKVLAVVRILVLIFVTSWESVNVGVVKQSFIPITPGETLLKEERK